MNIQVTIVDCGLKTGGKYELNNSALSAELVAVTPASTVVRDNTWFSS